VSEATDFKLIRLLRRRSTSPCEISLQYTELGVIMEIMEILPNAYQILEYKCPLNSSNVKHIKYTAIMGNFVILLKLKFYHTIRDAILTCTEKLI